MGYYTDSHRTSADGHFPRNVEWPDGAPPQKKVPHAGALVRYGIHQLNPATVLNGIPFQQNHGSGVVWCITVQYRNGQHTNTVNAVLSDITPWVIDDEPCYTEKQIREAFEHKRYKYIDTLMRTLKNG